MGASGSGKSTILALLERLYEPGNGAIEIDGVDTRTRSAQAVRQCMGLVEQVGRPGPRPVTIGREGEGLQGRGRVTIGREGEEITRKGVPQLEGRVKDDKEGCVTIRREGEEITRKGVSQLEGRVKK